ncbi:hypothetical protein [Chryseobacterium balustinum]|uniref:Uncharacterized protein n=1 Tax=Chryseobacterium balustinum TaxID=246 RepID=A0AAX2IHN1_9FLAO|nr:hypothetical protein [Chryseobacterium balustinum]AZB27798.1 hypothetical protein EB354_00015 [Chryseobacterium balustinum]SKC06181.1 hypothetical protein SAMN05421800_12548 [Chryseobacterium balustinum]SQA86788.1 Uncharacterised protein [Chryseobacterium balustinum]
MKKYILIIILILICLIIILNIDFPVGSNDCFGKYANMNYDAAVCCVEAPHEPDTLILHKDGSFTSKFYGNGTFVTENGLTRRIILKYSDFGKGSIYNTYFTNKINEELRIILNADSNHYYEKIK